MASSILTGHLSYPWREPLAQELHMTLTRLYPSSRGAGALAEKAGIEMYNVNSDQAPVMVWKEILDEATRSGLAVDLVAKVLELSPKGAPGRRFMEALLNDTLPPTEGDTASMDRAPAFLANDDTISEDEALLYYDDLTIQIGRVPRLITALQLLVAMAPAVCKLSVDFGVALGEGTAFRTGPDQLLTNWHVLHLKDGTRANAVTAEFGYEDDGSGGVRPIQAIRCDPASIAGSAADDWAVICAQQPLQPVWPVVALSRAVAASTPGAAYIIQHPGGQRKRLGFVRNQISYVDDRVVQYLTDTREGSSGSPVFNERGELIALHHAGGRPQEVLGRAPAKKNEGIRISRIVAEMQARGIPYA